MLAPCSACRRHVRLDAAACPFCGATCAPPSSPPSATRRRLSRSAMVTLASSLAIAGCGSSVALYGAPAPLDAGDAGDDGASDADDASDDADTGPAAPTIPDGGGPPVDAATDALGDAGSPGNLYGAPPPDAGDDA